MAELDHFRHCITDAAALALAGVMLKDDVDQTFRDAYREHLVVPRRARLRAAAQGLGEARGHARVAGLRRIGRQMNIA